ncbi:hypothetical protein BaRGS_00040587, partial [Batillaria attramentaria]
LDAFTNVVGTEADFVTSHHKYAPSLPALAAQLACIHWHAIACLYPVQLVNVIGELKPTFSMTFVRAYSDQEKDMAKD